MQTSLRERPSIAGIPDRRVVAHQAVDLTWVAVTSSAAGAASHTAGQTMAAVPTELAGSTTVEVVRGCWAEGFPCPEALALVGVSGFAVAFVHKDSYFDLT